MRPAHLTYVPDHAVVAAAAVRVTKGSIRLNCLSPCTGHIVHLLTLLAVPDKGIPNLGWTGMSSEEPSPIINSVVYLNYLSPGTTSEFELNRNVTLVTLGVCCDAASLQHT